MFVFSVTLSAILAIYCKVAPHKWMCGGHHKVYKAIRPHQPPTRIIRMIHGTIRIGTLKNVLCFRDPQHVFWNEISGCFAIEALW